MSPRKRGESAPPDRVNTICRQVADGARSPPGEEGALSAALGAARLFFFTGASAWAGGGDQPAGGNATAWAARIGDWKAVATACWGTPAADDPLELYDLATDPAERRDLAAARPAVAHAVRRRVIAARLSCACYQCG